MFCPSMKTLILCVDRDDDVGVKADITGPIVGREANLAAAMKLGLADPEDADVNTILTGLSMYDELVKNGVDAEIATVCGDPKVGYTSDTILMRQLDAVLEEVKPDHAYLVSDGAEDEQIFPMFASRVKVNHVKRVFVKQSPKVESFLYMMSKAAKEPRWRRKLIIPIGLALVVSSLLAMIDPPLVAPTIGIVLGFYLIFRAYEEQLRPRHIYEWGRGQYGKIKSNILEGKVSFVFDIVALLISVIAIFLGVQGLDFNDKPLANVLRFLGVAPWYIILALIIHEGGKVVEAYFTRGKVPRSFWVIAPGLVALGLIFVATIQFLAVVFQIPNAGQVLNLVWFEVGLGAAIFVAAILIFRSIEREAVPEDAWRP